MNFNLGQFPTYESLFPVLRTKTTSLLLNGRLQIVTVGRNDKEGDVD